MAALAPNAFTNTYTRHRPEKNLLYRTVQTYWPLFLKEQSRLGKSIPHFIRDEFEDYLKCGIPEFGIVRTYCHHCRYSGVVAFSCKRRGFCPSCCARRMNDEAAHLVDQVLPKVAYRQWVISFPYKLRFLMAYNQNLTNQILSIFIQTLNSYQKKKAKRYGIKNAKLGSVTFIQRFGSALNLNVHFHTLFADGVFYKLEEEYKFFQLPAPTKEELFLLTTKIQSKVIKLVENLGVDENEQNQSEFNESLLGDISKISIGQKAGFGERAGSALRRYGINKIEVDPEDNDPYSVNVEGFSLNARVLIVKNDCKKLEKLIRYMARGPIATERLIECFPNSLVYKLKTPWRDGTREVGFSHLDFIARLVALIPPAKFNMVRYFGVFAPNFKDRKNIVPKSKPDKLSREEVVVTSDLLLAKKIKRERMRWSEMLKRVFKIDVTVCPKCQGRLEQIAVIKDKVVIKAILKSLNEVSVFLPMEAVDWRGPPTIDEYSQDLLRDDSW